MAMPLDLWRLNCLLCVQGDDGDVEEMEVDLRSKNPEERTLHWFVRGEQQDVFIKGVPPTVQFFVYPSSY